MDYLDARVEEVVHLGSDYALLRFRGERPIWGEPGQFVMVRGEFGDDPVLPRAFSIVETGNVGAVLLRVVGKVTKLLYEMQKNELLWVLGPVGRGFPMPSDSQRPVLVAGGVGVAPLVLLAEKLVAKGNRPVCVFGGRAVADLPLRDRLEKLCDLTVTTEDGSHGEKGLVTEPLLRIIKQNKKTHLYSCGPTPMLRAVADMAIEANLPCHVALESPMACGMGTCKGCAVPSPKGGYVYVCSDGPVFEARELFGGQK